MAATSSRDTNDWRKLAPDMLSSTGSPWSKDDFTGRAWFQKSRTDVTPYKVDLVINDVEFAVSEHVHVLPHVGDTFSWTAYGKRPLVAVIQMTLIDTPKNFGKRHLVDLYRNTFRLTATARTGVFPVLRLPKAFLEGPLVSMSLRETSKNEDAITGTFEMLVMRVTVVNEGKAIELDYMHGADNIKDFVTQSGQRQQDSGGNDLPDWLF